ncbi:MAG TPA: translation initiation factor IF-2 [Gemmatimonadaceae bacterium]|nr:translation initiation factor IF-2 [Gemmatimonadaceae bacterium]
MSKLRVHDLASEFGISSDEVVNLLRQMDVPVRSHLSPLSDDQVARIRARWEREKRARVAAPPATARRRRGATAAPAPEAKTEAAPAGEASTVRRRRRVVAEAPPEPSPAPVVSTPESRPAPIQSPPAAAPPIAASAEAPVIERPRPTAPQRPAPSPTAPTPPAAQPSAASPSTDGRERQRPQPVVPGAPRPRPIATGAPFTPPRPVASAAPGAGSAPTRREDRQPSRGEDRGGRRGKKGKRGVDQEAVQANIGKTMASMRGPVRRGPARRDDGSREELAAQRQAEAEREKKTVRVNEFITVSELAQILKVPAVQIVGFAFKNLGLMITINQRLDFDQIELIAGEFGFQAVKEEEYAADLKSTAAEDTEEQLHTRPPVVTIMGHVDHGKTSLLDYIRKSNVVAGESGGITQHIGAYHVTLPGNKSITFLDTPGHEAFTAMRARGAQVTDIVVLVVAADDQVMPQTVEAISHAKNAGVPMIVAINKIDLPGANPFKVKQDLLQHGVVLEEFGGTVLSSEVSAKKGTNIDALLDQILLQAEILDLKANPDRPAAGAVIEAQLDPGKGPVATILVQNGTLRVSDDFICGMYSGRVRALLDERGRNVKEAGPAIPAQVLGIGGVPVAGDQFVVVEDAIESREIAQRRQRLDREAKSRRTAKGVVSLEEFMSQTAPGQKRTLRIVIKADQGGPAEALADALGQLSNEEVSVDVIHRGVGAITESDILLARASGAIIVGFHVRPDNNARAAAEREGVEIKLYKIIYEAIEDVRAALEGMLRPEEKEVVLGEAEVRELFKVPRMGVIAGCSVRSGVINRQARIRVIRDSVEIYDGNIGSLRRFKDDVKEVREGFECGIGIENFNDLKVGDVLECYRKEQVARTLTSAAGASA